MMGKFGAMMGKGGLGMMGKTGVPSMGGNGVLGSDTSASSSPCLAGMAGMMGMGAAGMMGSSGLPTIPGKGLLGMMGKGMPGMIAPLQGKGGPGMFGMGCPGLMGLGGAGMLGMAGAGAMSAAEKVDVDGPMGAGDVAPGALGTSSTLKEDPEGMEGLMDALKEFRRKWDIELRFEPKIIEHLKKHDKTWKKELERLDEDLKEAQVPPVCRSGYLLVLFGQVTESNTDEDFRKILCPNLAGAGDDKRDSDGDGCEERSVATNVRAAPTPAAELEEEWMMADIQAFCSRFNIDDTLRNRLISAMRTRTSTFKEDMNTLTGALKAARHPPGLLSLRIREMENGTFQTRGWIPADVSARTGAERPRSRSRERRRDRSRTRERKRERSRSKERRKKSQSRERRVERERDRERDRDRGRHSKDDGSWATGDP